MIYNNTAFMKYMSGVNYQNMVCVNEIDLINNSHSLMEFNYSNLQKGFVIQTCVQLYLYKVWYG